MVRVVDNTRSTAALMWTPVNYDGGSPVIGYIIEEAKSTKGTIANLNDSFSIYNR